MKTLYPKYVRQTYCLLDSNAEKQFKYAGSFKYYWKTILRKYPFIK